LLILDIDMPRLVLTAHHGESEEKALDLGAQDNLTKPVETRSLVARVRAALKRVTSQFIARLPSLAGWGDRVIRPTQA
jgi:DNA-binding response OmpR family regulator